MVHKVCELLQIGYDCRIVRFKNLNSSMFMTIERKAKPSMEKTQRFRCKLAHFMRISIDHSRDGVNFIELSTSTSYRCFTHPTGN